MKDTLRNICITLGKNNDFVQHIAYGFASNLSLLFKWKEIDDKNRGILSTVQHFFVNHSQIDNLKENNSILNNFVIVTESAIETLIEKDLDFTEAGLAYAQVLEVNDIIK